jgi:hypothetical protein
LVLTIALLWGSAWLAPAAAEEKWGPFRGRIVDAETGQPIQGAVVLMIWYELVYAVVQTNMEFYDAKEAVSGPDGTFEIPRLSPPFFTFRIYRPSWTLFAPGYEFHRQVVTPQTGQALVAPTVIEMRRLKTREERLKNLPSIPGAFYSADPSGGALRKIAPREKIANFLRVLNEEETALGLKPTQY